MTTDEITRHTNAALRKIDRNGAHGLSMVSFEEIEAMALTIVAQAAAISLLQKEKHDD